MGGTGWAKLHHAISGAAHRRAASQLLALGARTVGGAGMMRFITDAWKAVVKWYQGTIEVLPPDVGVVGFTHEIHWTARIARALVGFWLRHWQWIIGTGIAIVGLYLAYLALYSTGQAGSVQLPPG